MTTMTNQGILAGLDVLDVSSGIAGPMVGVLLADHGAAVTRIEPPGGDPFETMAGSQVWLRGNRRATLDLHSEADREVNEHRLLSHPGPRPGPNVADRQRSDGCRIGRGIVDGRWR
jgi:crotonobetainyl-CoA:carnitine CoA-transferase CaiB-like acyl-CoA transferase